MEHAPSTAVRYKHLGKYETSQIGRLFIQKIVDARPEGVTMPRWVEIIFGLNERFFLRYKAIRDFDVPGYYKPVPGVRIPGLKRKKSVREGKTIWVRFDLKYPEVIELEAPIGLGEEPRIFQMNRLQWISIKNCLLAAKPKDVAFDAQAVP